MTKDSSPQQNVLQAVEQAFVYAEAQHRAGKLQEAEQLYRAILQLSPAHPEANHNMGVLSVQSGQPASGLPHFMAALEADPARGQYWLSYIDALYRSGQTEDARQVLALAKQQGLQGEEIDALVGLLEAQTQSAIPKDTGGSPPAAVKPGCAHNGGEPSTQERNQIVKQFNEGRYAEVVPLARELTERYPGSGFGWNVLGAALKQTGQTADALLPMQKAAALSPGDSNALCNLGAIQQDLGQSQEAEANLKRALQINPSNADAHCNLALVLQCLGQSVEAEAGYRRALQLKPDLAVAHCNLGMTLHSQGRMAEAETSYRNATRIRPDFAAAHSNLGITLQSMGRLEEAAASLRQALQIQPDFADAHSSLGITLQQLGKPEEALFHFRERVRLTPGNVVAQHQIDSLTGKTTERAPDQYVEKVFDNYAERFDTHLQKVLLYDIPGKLVTLLLRHMPAGEKKNVLDLGCGTGLIATEIAPHAQQLVGVDLSAKMLEKARARNLYQRLERSDLLGMMQGEKAASHDLVIAADVFVYVGRLEEIVAEVKRLLTPGGMFAFSTEALEDAQGEDIGYRLEPTGRYSHAVAYLSRLAAANGFRVLESVPTRIRTEHGKPVNGHMAVWQN